MSSEVKTFALKMPNRGKGRFKGNDHKLHHHAQSVISMWSPTDSITFPYAKQLAPQGDYCALLTVLCCATLQYTKLCFAVQRQDMLC